MILSCPKCNKKAEHKIISINDGSDNVDNLGHSHMECVLCGQNWNWWHDNDKLKKILGNIYDTYK